jgi:hypothetical protein
LLHVAAGYLFEFKIPGDIGRYQDVRELARGHEELGDQVDVPVVETTILLPRFRALCVVAILLEKLLAR